MEIVGIVAIGASSSSSRCSSGGRLADAGARRQAIAADTLRREQEQNLTDATYAGDRLQIRPRR
jgi:hypothetical protein